MRTKRATGTKKRARKTVRATRAVTPATAPKNIPLVPGIDGFGLAIAIAVLIGAGVLIAAEYKPAQPADAQSSVEAMAPASPQPTVAAALEAHPMPPAAKVPAATSDTATEPASNVWPAPLTITGCLERNADTYRLTDAAGTGVERSRSWKSGFLKKSTASVVVIDADHGARLQDHLGQRVSVTGTLVNREMQIGSLRLLSESCSDKTRI